MEDKLYKGIIYKYTSLENKIYIGTTINEKERRRRFLSNCHQYAGYKINNARAKFGPKTFKYEVIFSIQSYNLEEILNILDKKEVEFIKLFDSIKCGYNLSIGGKKCHNMCFTEESKQKKLDKTQKPILQYNLDGEFIKEWPSAKIAGKTLGISPGNICQVLKGNRYQCSNCIFRYKTSDDYPKFIEINPTKQQKKIILKLNKNGDIIKEYPSIESAAIDAGVNRATMSKYVNGHVNSLKHTNYIWRKKYE